VSFDTTKEAFYGEQSKAEDKKYLHEGSIANDSKFYYEYLTCAITSSDSQRYILDAIIVPCGYYMEDYVKKMVEFIKQHIKIEVILFDRGFGSWGLIYTLKNLGVSFIIFWKKQGNWYKEPLKNLQDGEFKRVTKKEKYRRNKTTYWTTCDFIIIKQFEYEKKKYDWIFAINITQDTAKRYVMLYKKRWGIETIYRVTDDIRIFTTSTNAVVRNFLFAFTCYTYNVWKFFQTKIGETLTLANFKICTTKYFIEKQNMIPQKYLQFEKIAEKVIS
jgi:putative transposase